jgi:hypothetical protein
MNEYKQPPNFANLPPLSDEATAPILEFLYQLVEQFETHFYAQLRRYPADPAPDQDYPIESFTETDPPF